MDLTQDILKEYLCYDPDTGIFTWIKANPLGGRSRDGEAAGSINEKGYVKIKFLGKMYRAHRLAWFYMTGQFPKYKIDHIDRNRQNNKFTNLREATHIENSCNRGLTTNQTNYKGVRYHSYSKKYQARINVNRRRFSLGFYDTAELAYAAYCEAAKKYHGEFACLE